jgi:hypothetical protein
MTGLAAGALCVLAGCGGGGGDGGTGGGGGGSGGSGGSSSPGYPLTITVSQSPITASVAQIDLPGSVSISASVQGTTTATTIYVVIVDAAATFGGTPTVSQSGPSQYQASLMLADPLTIGTHSGNLQISLCGDPQCANVLGRTTAPYTITITENPVLTGTWSRSSVALAAVVGDEQVTWPLSFTTPTTRYIPYARFSDSANVLRVAGDSQTIGATWGTKDIALTVSPDAAPGTYSGNLDMVYCRDSACNKMYSGVTKLPYTVSVAPKTNLKSLAPLAGAPDWQTVQGSSAHTGYVPVTLSPASFSPRWQWQSPDRANIPEVLEPVTSNGKVFTMAAPSPTTHITPILFAIDEESGTASWQQPVPDTSNDPTSFGLGPLIPPAIAGGNVYVARTVNTYPPQEGRFFAFQASDGTSPFAPQNFAEVPAQFGDFTYSRPYAITNVRPVYMTASSGSMLLGASDTNGASFVSLDQASGVRTAAWASCASARSPARFAATIAVDGSGKSYAATDSGLLLADTCDSIASAVPLNDGMGPAIGATSVVAIGGGNLVSFDTGTRQVKWSAPKSDTDVFVGSPAIAGATVYVQNAGRVQLEARRESDGEVLWTWQAPWSDETSFGGNVVATDNLVFVSTTQHVYAIDTTTHQAVWIYPYAGKLAISANGVLYVRRGPGSTIGASLVAINLH